jgi:hypothetical protein
MKTFDLNSFAVLELDKTMLIEVNGGETQPSPSPWWSVASALINAAYIVMTNAAKTYIEYCEETGGEYVIHHAY